MVEDTHFVLDYFSAADLGHKSLAVNLSDIAAMGAEPHFVQVSLALPPQLDEGWIEEFYQGMTFLADKFSCEIIGGDLTSSSDKLVIDVSVIGCCEHPLRRHGAVAGDLLLVSGTLGVSHTGMLSLQNDLHPYANSKEKHLRPMPRLDLVRSLQQHHDKVHALMDCSDGLVSDVLQMSGDLGFNLWVDDVPLHPETQSLAAHLNHPAIDFALWGGEDYELLLSIPPESRDLFPEWRILGTFTPEPGFHLSTPQTTKKIESYQGYAGGTPYLFALPRVK